MYSRASTPLRVAPGRSRALAAWIVVVHVTALASLPLLHAIPWAMRLLAALAIVGSVSHGLRLHALRTAGSSVIASTVSDHEWLLLLRNGVETSARLCGAFVRPWLVIVRLQTANGGEIVLVLPADALSRDTHRHLRVRLLARAHAAPHAG